MARPDGRLEPGQPLGGAISARAWNRAQDAADLVMGRQGGFTAGEAVGPSLPYTWVYCKASTTFARWAVVAITGVEITPTSSDSDAATKSFQDTPVVTGGTPSETTTAWGVAVEPIESGKIGRVAVGGVVQCKIADLGKASGCQVIWKDSNWALVRIDAGVATGTFALPWPKGTTKTVTVSSSSSASTGTRTVTNLFAELTGSGNRSCAVAYASGQWVLIATEC